MSEHSASSKDVRAANLDPVSPETKDRAEGDTRPWGRSASPSENASADKRSWPPSPSAPTSADELWTNTADRRTSRTTPADVDAETVRAQLLMPNAIRNFEGAMEALESLLTRLRTAEADERECWKQRDENWRKLCKANDELHRLRAENAALVEGAANVGMERDMAMSEIERLHAENERYREALERLTAAGSWHYVNDAIALARAALKETTDHE